MPHAWTIHLSTDPPAFITQPGFVLPQDLSFPIVGKPIRGRGSHGVKVCYSFESLHDHLEVLSQDSPIAMLEQYLSGEEATNNDHAIIERKATILGNADHYSLQP